MAMTFRDEVVETWIEGLDSPGERAYARSQWAFLQGRGPRPDPQDYNLGAAAAEAVRIKLAGMK
jgi:hypothetical protein